MATAAAVCRTRKVLHNGVNSNSDKSVGEVVNAANADLVEAGDDLNSLIQDAQAILTSFLLPDSKLDEQDTLNALLALFGGPRQRRAQARWAEVKGE